MSNLKDWILEMADGESVEAVVIGEMGWGDYKSESVPNYENHPRNVVLSWETAKVHLDYEFDSGYGAPGCEEVCVWTKSWVIFVSQYDGATAPHRVPRNPTDHEPIMPGG